MTDDPTDPKDLVRRGYDALSWHYRTDDADDGPYGRGLPRSASARRLVPTARFVLADATQVAFPTAAFDAIVCP